MYIERGLGPSMWCSSAEPSLCPQVFTCCKFFCMQVLFNMAPVSYTAACTATTTAAIQSSVIPPGVTLPAGSTIPPLVSTLAP